MRTVGVFPSPRSIKRWIVVVTSFVLLLGLATFAKTPSASASTLGPTNAQRSVLAHAKAKQLLTLAILPPHSTRLRTWIAADGKQLAKPMAVPDNPDLVDETAFYLATPGTSALAWTYARTPMGASVTSTGSGGGPGSGEEKEITYNFASTSLLPSPELEYSMMMTPQKSLEIRVDAIVAYTPRKSLLAVVRTGAVMVKVVVNRGMNTPTNRVTTAATTNGATIADFLSEVNALPAAVPGVMSCPFDDGSSVSLDFYTAHAAHAYAVVVTNSGGCGTVRITQWNARGQRLGATIVSGGVTFATNVAKAMGIANPG